MGDTYSHGHHESVLRSHTWRTVENSAGHLLPWLVPGQRVLDVGCGPGTITLGLASRVAPGEVTGLDAAAEVIDQAEQARVEAGVTNARFVAGDVYSLDFDDDTFDVVHAHQVLQHLTEPVAALREARRVLRPGGLVAVRDSDYAAFAWAPRDPRLDRWNDLYHQITARNRAEADAGRFLLGWVQDAGFAVEHVGSSTWTFADPELRTWWGDLWADRVLLSSYADQAVGYGLCERTELVEIAAAWRGWAEQPDGFLAVVHGEVLGRA